jgi:hypothetical protein
MHALLGGLLHKKILVMRIQLLGNEAKSVH